MVPVEHFFTCPYCWQNISMVLEPSEEAQSYIEDCEVCCQPIQITFSGDEGSEEIFNFDAQPAQGN
ncbi:MAG: CPXCG motif-containing cysteine-rich protein [Bdellovibrionales bacterium]|nr:CPXCG motif-containing cysteine-rich protein [Bdellovibrionales bacterium]